MPDITLKYGIVIPCYKAAGTIKRCLTSLTDQKYKDKKILCVLDGGDPETVKIIKTFKDVEYVILDTQQGAPKARNFGARVLEKEVDILLFWDADCYMEPGALTEWATAFTKNPNIDFIYSDYRFTIPELGAICGEEFNPYLLKCNNYISTMSPIRAKLEPRFDEELESLQDWDLFLTLTEKGHKGKYIPGVKFITEPPTEHSISGKGCLPTTWLERKNRVKDKHNIPHNPICFTSLAAPERAWGIAERLGNADFSRNPGFNTNDYKMVYLMGFYSQDAMNHASVFKNGPKGQKKVVHWIGSDVDALYQLVPMKFALELGEVLGKEYINLCETPRMKGMLEKVGIKAEILKLPVNIEGLPDVKPKEFKVLCDIDTPYEGIMKMVKEAMPDVTFDELTATDMTEYYAILRLSTTGILDESVKKFLCSGRKVLSNIQEPYAGYIGGNTPDEILKKITTAVRKAQENFSKDDPSLEKAKKYYLKALSWDNYVKTLNTILDKGLLWKTEEKKVEKSRWYHSLSRVLTGNRI